VVCFVGLVEDCFEVFVDLWGDEVDWVEDDLFCVVVDCDYVVFVELVVIDCCFFCCVVD